MEKTERKVKRCYIYSRVSTEEQARGQYTSIEAQEDRCKHAIAIKEDQGWIHAGTIKDPGYSGKDMNRPGMQKLLSLIRTGQVDVILTYRIDRLSRSILAFYDFHGLLEKHHVELYSITESFDTSTTVGRLMLNIILSFAQYERELAQERTIHKMQQHAEKGFWNGGMVPYGYELTPTDGNGEGKRVLQIVEDEAEIVRLMYKLYLQKQNVAAICKTLYDRSIRTRVRTLTSRGGEKRKGGGKPFYETAVIKMLRNPLYTGKIRYSDKVFPGQHPGIIAEKTFNAVQRLLDANARQTVIATRDDHTHPLKGLIKCGPCEGNAYTPYPSGKKDPKTGQPYLYYACTTFTKSRKYGEKIRDLVAAGTIAGPQRATPSPEVVQRAIEILREWDTRHHGRTGRLRAYHLAARLQVETAARSVSSTMRVTLGALKEGNQIELVAKGGKRLKEEISPELHAAIRQYLSENPGVLADRNGYRTAWRRAVLAAGGKVTGTHGLRRRSVQDYYRQEYYRRLADGASPGQARREARAAAVERLGHGRDRTDQAKCYLGDAA